MSLPARAIRKIGRKLGAGETAARTPHAELYADIVRSIAAGAPLPISAAEAMKSLQLTAGAYEAAILGEAVTLPLGAAHKTHGGLCRAQYEARPRPSRTERPQATALAPSRTVRIGLIGLDTTHATTFADLLHNPYNPDHIPGARVVAAFPGGSPDMAISAGRVGGFTAELRDKYGVPILETPEAVSDAADVVCILSSDGRTHPGLFRSIADRGKPIFIDKPFAISSADAELIRQIGASTGAKLFATSAYRYADALVAALADIRATGEQIRSCRVRYWGQIQPTQGRLFWYGIHGAEMLTTVMGKGAREVSARTEGSKDILDVSFADGRAATLVGDQADGAFHVTIETDQRTVEAPIDGPISARLLASVLDVLTPGGYPRLWRASDAGSVSGRPGKFLDPVLDETVEVIGILDAGQRSLSSGAPVSLAPAHA
jgi:predicted dehydrogenase